MDAPLRPDRAPRWLVPLLEAIDDGGAEIPRTLLSPRVLQKDGADQAAVLILFAGALDGLFKRLVAKGLWLVSKR